MTQIANRAFVAKTAKMFALAEADGTLDEKLAQVSRAKLLVLVEAGLHYNSLIVYAAASRALAAKPKMIWDGENVVEAN